MIRYQLIGGNEVQAALLDMVHSLPAAATDAALAGAQIVEGFAKREGFRTKGAFLGTKTSKKGKTRKTYAALGGAIAGKLTSRTGKLRASIRSQKAGPGVAVVGPTAVYGRIHEFGGTINISAHSRLAGWRKGTTAKLLKSGRFSTKQRVKVSRRVSGFSVGARTINMPARPYLRPAFENHRDDVQQAMIKELVKALARHAK